MPEPLTDAGPDVWPFRHVGLSCDHPAGCDADIDADIRADTFEQALPFLLDYARRQGWYATDDGRTALCPAHKPAEDPAAPLLGVPGGQDGEG
jgi:hypothetical protein